MKSFFYKTVRLATFAPTFKRNGNNNIIMRKKKKHCLQCEKYIVLHEYNLVVGQKLIYKFLLSRSRYWPKISDENWFSLNTFILIRYIRCSKVHGQIPMICLITQIPAVQTILNSSSRSVFTCFICKLLSVILILKNSL